VPTGIGEPSPRRHDGAAKTVIATGEYRLHRYARKFSRIHLPKNCPDNPLDPGSCIGADDCRNINKHLRAPGMFMQLVPKSRGHRAVAKRTCDCGQRLGADRQLHAMAAE
jgi:hypothetical protein